MFKRQPAAQVSGWREKRAPQKSWRTIVSYYYTVFIRRKNTCCAFFLWWRAIMSLMRIPTCGSLCVCCVCLLFLLPAACSFGWLFRAAAAFLRPLEAHNTLTVRRKNYTHHTHTQRRHPLVLSFCAVRRITSCVQR